MTKVKLFLVTVCEFKLQKIKSDTSRGEESVGGGRMPPALVMADLMMKWSINMN